uniref:AMOP domain-containing protein n=1 Tax=Steinernema glaseri TaxID=37863 RepID=A0A1I7Z463_9BILA
MWSKPTPFAWYHEPQWRREYGSSWATDMCIQWFEYDGKRRNFQKDLTAQSPCPCKLAQALLDLGRYMPIMNCDKDGDTSCPYNKGAQHCVQSVAPSWTGASQQCCYDYEGYLMFTDDWEPDGDYTTYFQPGTPARAHAFGAYPYKNPPYIPSLSHYQLDVLPYQTCCHYAGHCEFYYWRRMTNGCQDYKPPVAGYIYGEPHIVTFDGTKYTFPGKGYYVLVMSEDPLHKLMVQVRMEQPDDTLWHAHPGTPARAHAFGAYPYKNPPYIPSLSHYQLDVLPYQTCCHYAGHCEFYYWRRMTNGCQDYKPPVAGYIYGEPHIVTFDGTKYTFPGKGYYVLVMSEDPLHKLMVQVRMEQPDDTLWHAHVNATVVTGITVQENDSSIVQVFARKPLRRWRYRTDVYVDGMRRFFDTPQWKFQQFNGVSIRSPLLNMDMSELVIMLNSGVGIKVGESNGMLDVMVFLPPSYNTTCKTGQTPSVAGDNFSRRCYTTMGLLGTYNNDPTDDLMTLQGTSVRVSGDTHNPSTTQMIYEQFGRTWLVDGKNDRIGAVMFSDKFKPIYNPPLFASSIYTPTFWPQYLDLNASRVFTLEQVKVACMGVPQCEYDYMLTGRKEIALATLEKHKAFLGLRKKGSRLQKITKKEAFSIGGELRTSAQEGGSDQDPTGGQLLGRRHGHLHLQAEVLRARRP